MFMCPKLDFESLSVSRFSGNVRQLPPQGDHRELGTLLIKPHRRSGTPDIRNWEDVSNCWSVSGESEADLNFVVRLRSVM